MYPSRFNRRLIAGLIVCGFLAFLLGRLGGPSFYSRWRSLKDGTTQEAVRRTLGVPSSIGVSGVIGAGDRPVTRWQYKRGRWTYYVDFDYFGPGGAPLVYRTERFWEEWEWPSWWPWQPPRARA